MVKRRVAWKASAVTFFFIVAKKGAIPPVGRAPFYVFAGRMGPASII